MFQWLVDRVVVQTWREIAYRTPVLYEIEECILAPHRHCMVDIFKSFLLLCVLVYAAVWCRYTVLQICAAACVWWLFQTELVCVWYIGDTGSPYGMHH